MATDMDDSPLPIHAEREEEQTINTPASAQGNADASRPEFDAISSEDATDLTKKNKQNVPCLSKKEQEDLLQEDEKLYEAQRGQQIQSLEEVKESLAEDPSLSTKSKAERRMTFLMAQSEVFTQFLMGGSTAIGKAMFSRSKARGSSRRSGDDECKRDSRKAHEVIDLEDGHTRVTRIMHQPKTIEFGTMKPYQLEGLNWMVRLHDSGVNGILADEMGLGKTLQSISLLAYLREERGMTGPHLIIVPKSTVGNWMRELSRWCPSINAFKFMGSKEERAELRPTVVKLDFDVLVLSYEVAIIERPILQKILWKYLLIDEAHRVKNEHSKLSRVVREFKVQHRLLITGTPLQNNLHELWALLNFLLPDIFTAAEDFDAWFNVDEKHGEENVIKKLHTILRPFLLRRLKADVEVQLPPKIETKLYVGLSEMQREWYMRVLHRDAAHLNAIGGSDRVRLLNILMQLRKVCNHPYLFEGAEPGPPYLEGPHLWENCGKLTLLHRLLPKLKAQGSRALIFCQMTSMMDILEDYMRYFNHEYCRLDGQTKGEERDIMMEEFNSPGSTTFCFLLSTRAGGLGINLATADIVILYDSDWNPQVDLQAMDRAHRIGQTKTVRVFRFISDGTVEEKIVERAERKLYLDAAIIQQGRLAQQNRKLSKDELMTMVRFGADEIFNARGSMITDDDIDAILAKGEERTEAMKSKVAADMQHSLANFSLLATESSSGGVSGLYEFEGANFAKDVNTSNGSILPSTFIALPQRERKTIYTDSELYGEASGGVPKVKKPKKSADTQLKIPTMHDYQFFQHEKLLDLYVQRHTIECHRKELLKQIKDAKSEEQKETQDDPTDVKVERPSGDGETLTSVHLEQELQQIGLSAEQVQAIEQLEEEGFGEWTRRDFKLFISACERYGRSLRDQICRDVANQTGKSAEYVERYYDTFWARYTELKDYQKYIDKIERGEKRLARNQIVKEALARKCSRFSDPIRDMKLAYPAGYSSKGFTIEEDVFLVVMMNKYAPLEHWSEIRDEIRVAWQFRFNWFIKSRAIGELQKRGEFLTRLIEKENEELRLKHERDEHTLKKKAAPASSSSSSKTKSRSSSSSKKSKRPSDNSSSQRKKQRAR
uniref:Putative SWI/SNF related putative n=1 Tax=Albugo laibachii Nc14 TaxID=890382 RepID=F0WLD7_9STRA|nr:Putative SWI/SNF related putative [Albugo laibachii Nc14]|eukprot:CCA22100.1 Putative SWI/SNF related putative [Albugo laibachii Nc14]